MAAKPAAKENISPQKGGVKVSGGDVAQVYGDIIAGRDIAGRDIFQTVIREPVDHHTEQSSQAYSSSLTGKGILIWQIDQCEGGDPLAIAKRAQVSGFSHLVIKVADGEKPYNPQEKILKLSEISLEQNRTVWGFQYVRGDQPEAEAKTAIQIIKNLSLIGYVIDAEEEYKQPQKKEAARIFMDILRSELGESYPIALSSFRLPSYHPQFPWSEFMERCSLVMPQVFWVNAHNPAAQLERSYKEYARLLPRQLLFLPIGSAHEEAGWRARTGEIHEFLEAARQRNLPGAAFWNWDYAGQPENLDLWQAMADYIWEPVQEKPQPEQKPQEQAPIDLTSQVGAAQEASPTIKIAEPELESRVLHIVHNDEVEAVKDRLNFRRYIDSFIQLVLDPRTQPPLVIGISGQWGSGKSFLLCNIARVLEDASREALAAKAASRSTPEQEQAVKIHTIRFNAWEYNATEVVWAGLVRKIIEVMEAKSHPNQRLLSRVRRNLKREIGSVRWKILPWTALLIAVLIVIVFLTRGDPALMTGLITSVGIAGLFTIFQNLVNTPLTQWITNLFSGERQYGKFIGYMEEIRADIEELKGNLPDGTKIVVMIDDLDRCEAEKIVEVLEAIKLLLDFDIFIIFMGIDASVVARAVEKRYKEVLAEAGRSGFIYLDKIIQIPFRIPTPDPNLVNQYLFALLESSDPRTEKEWQPEALAEAKGLAKLLQEFAKGYNGKQAAGLVGAARIISEHTFQWSDLPRIKNAAKAVEETRNETDLRLRYSRVVWSLLANFWPVSAYLMHKHLAEGLKRNDPIFQTTTNDCLTVLYDQIQATFQADFRSTRLRELADASQLAFNAFILLGIPLGWDELADGLKGWNSPYQINFAFTPAELEAFNLLSNYLTPNTRHIKRIVNTYSLIRILAGHSPDGQLVLRDPDATLKWMILSNQWGFTAHLLMQEFARRKTTLKPGETLPENDSVLPVLLEKVDEALKNNPELNKERDRLDREIELLIQLIHAGRPVSSKQLDLLHTYQINFHPTLG